MTLSNTVPAAYRICMIDSGSIFHAENYAVGDFFFQQLSFEQWMIIVPQKPNWAVLPVA